MKRSPSHRRMLMICIFIEQTLCFFKHRLFSYFLTTRSLNISLEVCISSVTHSIFNEIPVTWLYKIPYRFLNWSNHPLQGLNFMLRIFATCESFCFTIDHSDICSKSELEYTSKTVSFIGYRISFFLFSFSWTSKAAAIFLIVLGFFLAGCVILLLKYLFSIWTWDTYFYILSILSATSSVFWF